MPNAFAFQAALQSYDSWVRDFLFLSTFDTFDTFVNGNIFVLNYEGATPTPWPFPTGAPGLPAVDAVDLGAGFSVVRYGGPPAPAEESLGDAAVAVPVVWDFREPTQDFEAMRDTRLPTPLAPNRLLLTDEVYIVQATSPVEWRWIGEPPPPADVQPMTVTRKSNCWRRCRVGLFR